MQSVVSQIINKVSPLYNEEIVPYTKGTQSIKKYNLFRSRRVGVADGEQKRDFVFVDDVATVIIWFIENSPPRGNYNLGSGIARSFNELVRAVNPNAVIDYVDMPDALVPSYQYFTQANLTKLRSAGYAKPFTTLEDGIRKTLDLTKNPFSVQSDS